MSNILGLDIGSETIKLIQLDKKSAKPKMMTAAIAKNPVAGIISSSEKEMVPLVESLRQLKKEAGVSTNLVSLSLPERNIFVQTLELPKMNPKELEQAINWEAESLIPKPIAEVSFDWRIIEDEKSQKQGKIKVVIIAAPLTLISGYSMILKQAGLEPFSFESESLSLLRSIGTVVGKKNLIIFNWGMKSADIIVVKKGDFYLNRSLASTGEALTRAISLGLSLDLASAEEYKKTYGLSSDLEGKVGKTIQPLLTVLTNEIKKAINFFEEKEQEKLGMMILTGGSSLLYGVAEYFTQTIGLEVQIANPLFGLETSPAQQQELGKNAPIYSVVIGLAMKET
jgi:type IV pilus assembly protein PilM